MSILTRKAGQRIQVGDVTLTITRVDKSTAKLGVETSFAPAAFFQLRKLAHNSHTPRGTEFLVSFTIRERGVPSSRNAESRVIGTTSDQYGMNQNVIAQTSSTGGKGFKVDPSND